MAYEKTNWISGETPLSASNFNKIEDELERLSKIGGSNSNLIINGNLKVWLRGDSIAINSSSWTYTAEMFRCKGSGAVTRDDDGLKVSGTTQIQYKMETNDFSLIEGKVATLTYSINGGITSRTFTVNNQVVFDINLSSNDTLNWVVLILGETSVEAPIPESYALTELKCARYCQAIENLWVRRTTNTLAKHFLPVKMRVAPTVIGTIEQFSMAGTSWGNVASSGITTQVNQIVVMISSSTADWYIASEKIICDAQDYE